MPNSLLSGCTTVNVVEATMSEAQWTTIGHVLPGDQIAYYQCTRVPAGIGCMVGKPVPYVWKTVVEVFSDGRSRVLTFDDGTEFDAGHAYRLWVRR